MKEAQWIQAGIGLTQMQETANKKEERDREKRKCADRTRPGLVPGLQPSLNQKCNPRSVAQKCTPEVPKLAKSPEQEQLK